MEWKVYQTEFESKVKESFTWMLSEFDKIVTGRANTKVFNDLIVNAYDQKMKLFELANLHVDGSTITIKPYDRSLIKEIVFAINKANLNLNPLPDTEIVRVKIPSPTEETRKAAVKTIKDILEKTKTGIRKARQDVLSKIKKDEELREDELKHYEKDLDVLTKSKNTEAENYFKAKEKELTTI